MKVERRRVGKDEAGRSKGKRKDMGRGTRRKLAEKGGR